MGEIVVKVLGEAGSGSVSLPDDVPLAALIGGLSRHYAPGACADPMLDAGGTVLDLDAPLSEQAVADGAELRISRRPAPPESKLDDPDAAELGVTVVGSNGVREALRVPACAPMRVIAGRLADAIGVAQVADVRLGDGTLVPPTRSLADMGVRTGASLLVRELGDPAPAPVPPTGKRSRRVGRLRLLAAGLAVVVAASVGVAVGRASVPGSTTGSSSVFQAAAAAWPAAAAYRGSTWPGVGRNLGRKGKLALGLEPAGSWRAGDETGQAWIVSAPGGARWGLEAVAFGGRLGYDPTPSGLPFVTGEAPPIAGRVVAHPGRPPKLIGAWAATTWGRHGTLTAVVGTGASAPPRVLAVYRPAGGGLVWRVQVDLANSAPGAPLSAARKAVSADRAAVVRAKADLASAQGAVSSATSALAAAGAAKPAQVAAVAVAQKTLAGARGQVTAAQAALASARSVLASASAAEAHLNPASAVGTYDLWVRGGRVVGWAPAGYEGGGQ